MREFARGAGFVALVFAAGQCSGGRGGATASTPSGTVCYQLTFSVWTSSDSSSAALAPVALVSPLPERVAVARDAARRDTVEGRLRSTSGWSLMIRLAGSAVMRAGSAWLAPPDASNVGQAAPSATLNAMAVPCSSAAIPLEPAG